MIQLPESITKYLDGLTDEQQDRLLTTKLLAGGHYVLETWGLGVTGCLMQVAENDFHAAPQATARGCFRTWNDFDNECVKEGTEVGATAIRDYICERRTTRELATVLTEAVR